MLCQLASSLPRYLFISWLLRICAWPLRVKAELAGLKSGLYKIVRAKCLERRTSRKKNGRRGKPAATGSQSRRPALKRSVAAAGGEGAAAARGLLLAADCGADEILDGVGGGVIPFFGKRAAARPCGHGRGCVSNCFLRVANEHRGS